MIRDKNLYVRKASAGSGKTYTLAAHYIALLLHGESYRQILAVTFTNKATAEMKERILTYLHAIGWETELGETQQFLKRVRDISNELGYDSGRLTNEKCSRRAQELYNQILSDYDSMHVSTIDAFLQSLLAGMAQMLGQAAGYAVELNLDVVIDRAVDRLLTDGARNKQVKKLVSDYIGEQLDKEKSFDIRPKLKQTAKNCFNESVQENSERIVWDELRLQAFREQIDWQKSPTLAKLAQCIQRAERYVSTDFKNGEKSYIGPIRKIARHLNGEIGDKEKPFILFSETTSQKIMDAEAFSKICNRKGEEESVRQDLLSLMAATQECRKAYLRNQMCCEFLNDLVLMGYLEDEIQHGLRENNSRLLAQTAATLHRAMKSGDADFVLEKAGIRYKHIMLDEFQDTSSLQWKNFEPLLHEILSQEGSSLIVGDIKQSIYRWRNGDWTIMNNLDKAPVLKDHYNHEIEPLTRNFRSKPAVVAFNRMLFDILRQREGEDVAGIYDEGINNTSTDTRDGYVQLRCYANSPKDNKMLRLKLENTILESMFESIDGLLGKGVKARDMLILIRNNGEAKLVINKLKELQLRSVTTKTETQTKTYPNLAGVEIVSNDSFVLSYSISVKVVMAALRYIYRNDTVAKTYLQLACKDADTELLCTTKMRQMALTDQVEEIIRILLCDNGKFRGTDLAYLNCLKDQIRGFVAANGSDGNALITYWNDKMSESAIPASDKDGIRIMTIHSSKGLEAANVFIPFCNWEMEGDKHSPRLWCEVPELQTENGENALLPISQKSDMQDAGFETEYTTEHHLQRIDNLNLMYVAFTRAAERLYIYTYRTYLADALGLNTDLLMIAPEQYGEETAFAEYTVGDENVNANVNENENKNQEQETRKRISKVFSFQSAQPEEAESHSSESHIEFKQSVEARKYGWLAADEDQPIMDRQAFGSICHDILSEIGVYTTTEELLAAAEARVENSYKRGIIPTTEIRQQMSELIRTTITHPVVGQWFVGEWHLLREESLLYTNANHDVVERRMDRVMIQGNKAIVLDYKFGHVERSYFDQVREYMDIMRRMGYSEVSGYLWMAAEQRLIPVNAVGDRDAVSDQGEGNVIEREGI